MPDKEYHQRISTYYAQTENAYKDSWDLDTSLAIHFGYWDNQVHSFRQSLNRMNEVMKEAADIRTGDRILDAGCGVGGSSLFLARTAQCRVTGITLSERQMIQAQTKAREYKLEHLVDFYQLDFADTRLPPNTFDIVWGCESICYADNKQEFIREAFRILKPGGRLVVADGFVTNWENNSLPVIRNWLDGWQVNYLETPDRFKSFMSERGFSNIRYRDISAFTAHSSGRLLRFYYLANIYLFWKTLTFSKPATEMQRKNIRACRHQYRALKKGYWQYGLIVGEKPATGLTKVD